MTGTMSKSFTISLSICFASMMLIFSCVTGYALITVQTINVLDLYIASFSEDGMFIRVSTEIWYVMALSVTCMMPMIYLFLRKRKMRIQ
ncbi:hypothetical protein FHE72_17765 [Rossellomorea vietnamensis]|uniref:Uncharacterized protein n=1 Tax=Rossellomorea vietnamensis TaxID=218284 RepID=A0A6I6UMU7_9BACI|nr:hypothetical protein [Rossellomorea vietnamensis]QHE62667.1 hypothetical protein FHE72_17765 [Rossellomorea vietnamensis]